MFFRKNVVQLVAVLHKSENVLLWEKSALILFALSTLAARTAAPHSAAEPWSGVARAASCSGCATQHRAFHWLLRDPREGVTGRGTSHPQPAPHWHSWLLRTHLGASAQWRGTRTGICCQVQKGKSTFHWIYLGEPLTLRANRKLESGTVQFLSVKKMRGAAYYWIEDTLDVKLTLFLLFGPLTYCKALWLKDFFACEDFLLTVHRQKCPSQLIHIPSLDLFLRLVTLLVSGP